LYYSFFYFFFFNSTNDSKVGKVKPFEHTLIKLGAYNRERENFSK